MTIQTHKPPLLVIGAGPAGLSAAIAAKRAGVSRVVVVDREKELGGILNQCVHVGFGLFQFGENLTGPEYAKRLIDEANDLGVEFQLETFAGSLNPSLEIELFGGVHGYMKLKPDAVVLAMGCRERTRAAVAVPGTRPSGIFSAGTAQRLINVEGFSLGKRAVIVGSGDIGLIMARRLTLEGVEVAAVVEIRDTPSGLPRNVAQCLNAFSIPLLLKHRISSIEGQARVCCIVAESLSDGSKVRIECDLVLFSVGLIPENELSAMAGASLVGATNGLLLDHQMQTNVPGLFACGNAYRVYDLVDEAAREARRAGRFAAYYLEGLSGCYYPHSQVSMEREGGIPEGVPKKNQDIPGQGPLGDVGTNRLICTMCPKSCVIIISENGAMMGYGCDRGYDFAIQELKAPNSVLTGTVAIEGAMWPRLPCKTDQPLPRHQLRAAAAALSLLKVYAPVFMGDLLYENLGGLGVNVIATKPAPCHHEGSS
jgi:NADPH-dependent 2,4-dienoyl-CoA reductase/sulfur reductase-like enzyme/CxxC motif-containing protein